MWPFAMGKDLGRRGEDVARRFLKRKGLKILARNYRCRAGEVDLIALDRSTRREMGAETVAFVEVKTRSSDRYTDPEFAVDARKRAHLVKVARHYLTCHDAADLNVRFDVVAIVISGGEKPQVKYIPNAF
ncbi:MAG: YraN family protein [Phycisphaerae bacterium]|nr:YraN family protein [Phycisphaerae bacterium]